MHSDEAQCAKGLLPARWHIAHKLAPPAGSTRRQAEQPRAVVDLPQGHGFS
jgi:hypothetical protein